MSDPPTIASEALRAGGRRVATLRMTLEKTMLTYLQKYKELPQEIRDQMSKPEVISAISELEKKFNITLASVVMRVMVRDLSILDLGKYFVFEHGFDGKKAEELVRELNTRVFMDVENYLGVKSVEQPAVEEKTDDSFTPVPTPLPESLEEKKPKIEISSISEDSAENDMKAENWMNKQKQDTAIRSSNFFFSPEDEEEVMNLTKKIENFKTDSQVAKEEEDKLLDEKTAKTTTEMNLNFSSDDLNKRFAQIIKTYIKGVRNKVDTKQSLIKNIDAGGIGLNQALADKAVGIADKVVEEYKKKAIGKTDEDKESSVTFKADKPAEQEEKAGHKNMKPALKKLTIGDEQDDNLSDKPGENIGVENARDVPYDFSALEQKPSAETEQLSSQEPEARDENKGQAAPKKLSLKSTAGALKKLSLSKDSPAAEASDLQDVNLKVQPPESGEGAGSIKMEAGSGADEMINLANISSEKQISELGGENEEIKIEVDQTDSDDKDEPSKNMEAESVEEPVIVQSEDEAKKAVEIKQDAAPAGKVKMDDVKYVPSLVGPIDELRAMNLVNFRRFNPDPEAAAGKIKEKIRILEKESYAQKLKGINAWRESPINQMYLRAGQESLEGESGVNVVIDDYRKSGQDYLTMREFNALLLLNRDLRY